MMSKKEKRVLNCDHVHDLGWVTLAGVEAQTSAAPPAASAELPDATLGAYGSKSTAIIMGVVVIVFSISGLLSLYTRQCGHRRTRIRARLDLALPIESTRTNSRGVDQEVIQSFPTFLYSAVKGRGRSGSLQALACAVCLNEYQDEETLRLIPTCSHVFHPDCINAWLASHSTCPVCRANLLLPPARGDTPFVALHIPDPSHNEVSDNVNDNSRNVESPRANLLNRSGPSRLRSTGYVNAVVGPEAGEDLERFTLRLQQPNSSSILQRTKSCVTFTRMSSGRRGYRTRSVGSTSTRGRNYCHYDRFTTSHTFTNNPPLLLMDNLHEASSHRLCPT